MAACYNKLDNEWDAVENQLESLKVILSDISSQQGKLHKIDDWVKEQKRRSQEKAEPIPTEDVGKILKAVTEGAKKFESGSEVEIIRGVLYIISNVATLAGGPPGMAIKAVCGVIGEILIRDRAPKQPSVVDQLANAVHKELVNFNKRLQDQKHNGLKRRVLDQATQLRKIKPGEKLDDPNLWNDFTQFMGELAERLESPLSFKYDKESLTKDPDVADFVTAVVAYCQAYSCFMALLMAAKGKFSEMGSEYKEDEEAADRKISCQRNDAEAKLGFLSDGRYLTFLGSLPYEGGKLTKILVLSRTLSAKRLVEVVRTSLNMSQMPDLTDVESAAVKVSRQSVPELKLDRRHQVPPGNSLVRMVSNVIGAPFWVQFINETDFPMKVVLGPAGQCEKPLFATTTLNFVQDVQPRSSHPQGWSEPIFFSTGGYLMIYLNGIMSSGLDPPKHDVMVIEFALSRLTGWLVHRRNINIQDKTNDEFTRGQDAYNAMMKRGEAAKTMYWCYRDIHFIMRAEVVNGFRIEVWRFVVQDFDPLALQD